MKLRVFYIMQLIENIINNGWDKFQLFFTKLFLFLYECMLKLGWILRKTKDMRMILFFLLGVNRLNTLRLDANASWLCIIFTILGWVSQDLKLATIINEISKYCTVVLQNIFLVTTETLEIVRKFSSIVFKCISFVIAHFAILWYNIIKS